MKNWFTEHPKSVNETYGQHFLFSVRCSLKFLMAGFAGLIHAFLPFLHINTCSDLVAKLVGHYCKGPRREGFLKKLKDHADV